MVGAASFSEHGISNVSSSSTQENPKHARAKRAFKFAKASLENISFKPIGTILSEVSDTVLPVLSFAASVTSKKTTQGISIGAATIQGVFSLPQIAKRIHKGITSFKSIRRINKKLSDLSEKIDKAEENHDISQKILLQNQYRFFLQKKRECTHKITTLFHIPANVIDLAASVVQLTALIGSITLKVGSHALSSLELSAAVLGATAGGIAAILGVASAVFGLKALFTSQKKLSSISRQVEEMNSFSSSIEIPKNIFEECSKFQTRRFLIKRLTTERVRTKAILKICAGSFVTIGGALAIASSFTMGTTAIALAAVAAVISCIAIGVNIASYVKGRKMKQEIMKQKFREKDVENLGKSIEACSMDQKKEIARFFGLTKDEYENFCHYPSQVLQGIFQEQLIEQPNL
jgi:hypothetical protein